MFADWRMIIGQHRDPHVHAEIDCLGGSEEVRTGSDQIHAWVSLLLTSMICSSKAHTTLDRSFFINLFAGGSQLPSEKEATVGYTGKFMIDARAGTADIPGDGTANVTFTSAQDAAKFVAASLDLETWEEESSFVGETTTFEKVVGITEDITGKKFVRTYLKEGGGEKAEKLLESPFWKSVRT